MVLLEHRHIIPTVMTPFPIFPFACVHEDNQGHSSEKWRDFLWEVKHTPNALAIGLGDYMDFLRQHARDFLSLYKTDRDSFKKLHDWRRKAADDFCEKYLDPIRDKLIGLSLGNHHHEFGDGINDTMYMCQQLKVPYLGVGFFIRLQLAQPNRTVHQTFLILGHHGHKISTAQTMGGSVNALLKRAGSLGADIYIQAHNHQKHGTTRPELTATRNGTLKLIERPKAFIRAGCFVRGYVPNCVTYAEEKLYEPTEIGYVRLDIIPKQPYDPEKYKQNVEQDKKLSGKQGNLRYEFKTYS